MAKVKLLIIVAIASCCFANLLFGKNQISCPQNFIRLTYNLQDTTKVKAKKKNGKTKFKKKLKDSISDETDPLSADGLAPISKPKKPPVHKKDTLQKNH